MDFYVITDRYMALVHTTDEQVNHQEIKAKRIAGHASGKPLCPDGTCHNCGWKVPPKALWCCFSCASDHAFERAEFMARDGK